MLHGGGGESPLRGQESRPASSDRQSIHSGGWITAGLPGHEPGGLRQSMRVDNTGEATCRKRDLPYKPRRFRKLPRCASSRSVARLPDLIDPPFQSGGQLFNRRYEVGAVTISRTVLGRRRTIASWRRRYVVRENTASIEYHRH